MTLSRALRLATACCFVLTVSAFAAPQGTSSNGKELIKDKSDIAGPQKFLPPTKEEADAMMKLARDKAKEVSEKMGIKFRTIETAHFIMFTDWDPREENFLKTNVELAYNAVSKQFDIPSKDNVFVGKLPVFMFATHADFMKYAQQFDEFDVPETVAGYYQGNSLGHGHMVMWKPDVSKSGGNVHLAEVRWAYVLTHEFTHAFIARYRTNGFIPRWLNEGLAEVIASGQFPRPEVYPDVRSRKDRIAVQKLLEQTELLKAPDYPVARTLVETMIAGDRKAFISAFNDVKDGMSFEDALKKNYKTDKEGLEAAWRKYIQNAK
jgi:hypothetical protein